MGSQASSDGPRIVKTGGDRTKSEVKAMLKEVLRDYESSPVPDHRRADAPPLLHRRECGRAGRPAPDYGRSAAGHVVAILPPAQPPRHRLTGSEHGGPFTHLAASRSSCSARRQRTGLKRPF